MKIFLENINLQSSSGPNSFANKLIPHLQDAGHEFSTQIDADAALCFIESPTGILPCPRILRLDGIYFNTTHDYNFQNQNIRKTYDTSEGVIFQSSFCKNLVNHYFGEHKNSRIIHNGADMDRIKKTPAMEKGRYENIWCCASSWRPHKRLNENVRYFLEHKGDNDLLIVAGEVREQERVSDPNIVYFGTLNQIQLYSLYKASKYFLHLAWLDHCPNVVVDARACGCHIVCSSAGGTREIAGTDSTIIEEDEWDFNPIKLYEPPKIEFSNKFKNKKESCYNMREISREYIKFLNEVRK